MTDHHPTGPEPPEAGPLDELASAILDGAATDAELARADEPEVTRRVARFSALAEQVRQVTDGPAERREAAIAAALDAFEAPAVADELSERRARRAGWADPARRLRLLGAAAAAVVAIAVGATLLDTTSNDDQTTAADAVDDSGGGEEEAAAEADLDATTAQSAGVGDAASGGSDAAQPSAAPFDLGQFDSADQLVEEALNRAVDASEDTGFGTSPRLDAARCPDPTGGATRVDTAELDSRAVLVYVRADPDADAEPVVVVVDATTCEVLARRGR